MHEIAALKLENETLRKNNASLTKQAEALLARIERRHESELSIIEKQLEFQKKENHSFDLHIAKGQIQELERRLLDVQRAIGQAGRELANVASEWTRVSGGY